MTTENEIKTLIEDRQLSQWHLMVASLLGSLASQQDMFNQAFLNRILKHSMSEFIVPYFKSLPEYNEACEKAAQGAALKDKLEPVLDFMDKVFDLAGKIELEEKSDTQAVVKVGASGCRFCPIGVGKAKLRPGNTFCPFPTMIEETANVMLSNLKIKTVMKKEGMKTNILTKEDGHCFITYEMKQN